MVNNRVVRNTSLRRPRSLVEAACVSRCQISELPVFSRPSSTSHSHTSFSTRGNGADTWRGLPQPPYLWVEDLKLRPSFLNSLLSVAAEGPWGYLALRKPLIKSQKILECLWESQLSWNSNLPSLVSLSTQIFIWRKWLPHFQVNFLKLLFNVHNLMLPIGFRILLISWQFIINLPPLTKMSHLAALGISLHLCSDCEWFVRTYLPLHDKKTPHQRTSCHFQGLGDENNSFNAKKPNPLQYSQQNFICETPQTIESHLLSRVLLELSSL